MAITARSLVSDLQVGALRTTAVSTDPGGDGQRLRIERVEVSDLRLQTALGSVRAASVELSDVTATLPLRGLEQLPEVAIAELRVRDAVVGPAPVTPRAADGARKKWRLDPLASLDGTVHAFGFLDERR